MPGLMLKTVLVALGCLVAADIAGALACTLFDVLPLRAASPALAYVIWLVFGAFCGLFTYNWAGAWSSPKGQGDWSARPGARRIGAGVLMAGAVVIASLACLFYVAYWRGGAAGGYYVPDSEPHSLVFLAAAVGAMAAGRFWLMPTPP